MKTVRPERIGGLKLLPVPTRDGKRTPELIEREAWGWGDEHRAQPHQAAAFPGFTTVSRFLAAAAGD